MKRSSTNGSILQREIRPAIAQTERRGDAGPLRLDAVRVLAATVAVLCVPMMLPVASARTPDGA
jgi:hypothetical protein